jgi:hypothetical protein
MQPLGRWAGRGPTGIAIDFGPWKESAIVRMDVAAEFKSQKRLAPEMRLVAMSHLSCVASMMHKQREKNNDRQRNADQPKQSTFSERHDSLHFRYHLEV